MPKGPRGEKRPADAIGLAVMIGKIATGEIEDEVDATQIAAARCLLSSATDWMRISSGKVLWVFCMG